MQRRIIIAAIQVKLIQNCHNAHSSNLTYNLHGEIASGEILSVNDIENLQNWNINNHPNDINLYWGNLKSGIVKPLNPNTQKGKPTQKRRHNW